jgi:CheY-like chemotaxis protein
MRYSANWCNVYWRWSCKIAKSSSPAITALRNTPTTADIPIIAISAWANVTNEERALALGANRCIVKPFDLDEVMQAINACLNIDRTA